MKILKRYPHSQSGWPQIIAQDSDGYWLIQMELDRLLHVWTPAHITPVERQKILDDPVAIRCRMVKYLEIAKLTSDRYFGSRRILAQIQGEIRYFPTVATAYAWFAQQRPEALLLEAQL